MPAGATFHRFSVTYPLLRSFVLAALASAAPFAQAFEPPLQTPVMRSERLAAGPMLAVASAGERLVAVGLRGAILVSDDQGASWSQAQVPVSVDLVAVSFPSANLGWAVGHGGVVLHSADGGMTWQKQLDGQQAAQLAIDYYSGAAARIKGAEDFLAKERQLDVDGETQPFLDLYFADERHGYVVGTFNRIFATDDGGRTWTPLMHLTGNPQEWHFYSVSGKDGQLYLSGEQGHVWRRGAGDERFVSINTPYNGTLFGVIAADAGQLYAYGMRGSFFRSTDQGESWTRVGLPLSSNVLRVLPLGRQRLLAIAQSGEVALSEDGARTFRSLAPQHPMPYYGADLLDGRRIALAGALGVRLEDF
ncbi:MAG: WD40/YVTN/BNR-like repeat-containing protein [Pseudomonadaceae bacterium]